VPIKHPRLALADESFEVEAIVKDAIARVSESRQVALEKAV
jgi:hypothetical protein